MKTLTCGHQTKYISDICPLCNFNEFVEDTEKNNPITLFEKANNLIPLNFKGPKYTKWASEIRVEYAKKLIRSGKDISTLNDNLNPEYWIDNIVYFFGSEKDIIRHEKHKSFLSI